MWWLTWSFPMSSSIHVQVPCLLLMGQLPMLKASLCYSNLTKGNVILNIIMISMISYVLRHLSANLLIRVSLNPASSSTAVYIPRSVSRLRFFGVKKLHGANFTGWLFQLSPFGKKHNRQIQTVHQLNVANLAKCFPETSSQLVGLVSSTRS